MSNIHTYEEALRYIYSFINTGSKPRGDTRDTRLARLRDFLVQLDQPHLPYPILLIAGTKGKGSTAAMCESILRAAGYKTGFYSSPHLHSFRERIRLNGMICEDKHLISLVNQLQPDIEAKADLNFWEVMISLAFVAFAQAEVDVAVLEVGLGGRLDATNVTEPLVSVITPISYDHTQTLGKTLAKIAAEKGGIIRPQGTVVVAPQFAEAMTTIEAICHQREATLTVVNEAMTWRTGRITFERQVVYLNDKAYTLSLLGHHQIINAATALIAAQQFAAKANLTLPEQALAQGLTQVQWPGRLEILSRDPLVVVDSAMNGHSARVLRHNWETYFYGRQVILIFSASHDHNEHVMLRELLPYTQHAIMTRAIQTRVTPVEQLVQAAQNLGHQVHTASDMAQALQMALDLAKEDNMICVTGSLYGMALAREAWLRRSGGQLPVMDPVY